MLLATDPGAVGIVGAIATILAAALGWLFRGGLRDTTADRIFSEINDLKDEYKGRMEAAEIRVSELESEREKDREWKVNARMVMQECADGNPVMGERIRHLKLLEPK